MKFFKKKFLGLSLGLGIIAITLAYAGDRMVRYTYQGSTKFDLRSDGLYQAVPTKFGDNQTATSLTLPTVTTGSNFALWVPAKNIGPAVTQGDVLIASNTGTGYVQISTSVTDLTSVVGVAAESIASGAIGWIVPRAGGYAIVHTTGTVNIGQVLVTTVTASGYATGTATPTSGADFATAMSAGTASGGTVLAILH